MFNKLKKKLDNIEERYTRIIPTIFLFCLGILLILIVSKGIGSPFPNEILNTSIRITTVLILLTLFSLLLIKTGKLSSLQPWLSDKELKNLDKEQKKLIKKFKKKEEKKTERKIIKNISIINSHLVYFTNWFEFFIFSLLVLAPFYFYGIYLLKLNYRLLKKVIKNDLSKEKKKITIQMWAIREKNGKIKYFIMSSLFS